METSNIVSGIFIIITLPWIGWLSLQVIQNKVKINTLFSNDDSLKKEMEYLLVSFKESTAEMKRSFDKMESEVRSQIDGVNKRLDAFVSSELEFLKQNIKK